MKIGEKIKHLRVKNGLTLQDLASRCELSKGFISQVERDLTSPSISTLVDMLECLGSNLKDFFSDGIEEKVVIKKEDVFIKEDRDLKHTVKLLVPNSQKNMMEPILLSLGVGGSSTEDSPHDGEEFGYVLAGSINIQLGNRKYKAKKGESFYFKSSKVHTVSNAGKSEAVVLWISTPPNF